MRCDRTARKAKTVRHDEPCDRPFQGRGAKFGTGKEKSRQVAGLWCARIERLFDVDFRVDRVAGTEELVVVGVLCKIDTDGDTLDDLDVVAGRVFRREKGEL